MHICIKSIQIYFSIFFDFIVAFHLFHCSHTVTIFLIFFPIFLAILFTSKACHFDMAPLILLLFKHLHSHVLCGIKLYHMQHAHSLRHVEQSWHRGGTGYMWDEMFTRISLLSVLTVTEEVRTHSFYSFNHLINCIIVSIRYYQCISVLTVTEEFLLAKYSKFLIPTALISTL